MFTRSPETTACGILSALGLVTLLIGVLFHVTEAITVGITMIGAAASALGLLARSERQHEKDQPIVAREIAKDVVADVLPEAREEARRAAVAEVREQDRRG